MVEVINVNEELVLVDRETVTMEWTKSTSKSVTLYFSQEDEFLGFNADSSYEDRQKVLEDIDCMLAAQEVRAEVDVEGSSSIA